MILNRMCRILLCMLCLTHPAIAQHILFTELPTQQQLPTTQVFRAFQDKEGYMWYATEGGGLCRDDGYSIEIFRSDFKAPSLLKSNWITCITEDEQQKIWFGTKRGLYILDKKDYQIHLIHDKEIESWAIDAILAATDGTVWISANNLLLHYNAADESRIDTYSMKWKGHPRSVSQIYEDRDSNIWAIQWKGSICKFDSRSNDFISYPWTFDASPTYIIQDSASENYWISTWGKGMVFFNPNGKTEEQMFSAKSLLSNPNDSKEYILGIYQDTLRHALWTITKDNLLAYHISGKHELHPLEETSRFSTMKMTLNQLIGDRYGNIWVPSYYPHTFIISSPKTEISRCSVTRLEATTGYPALPIAFIYEQGQYWFCQRRSETYKYTPADDNLVQISHYPGIKSKKISPLLVKAKSGKGIYMVLNDREIACANYNSDKQTSIKEIVNLPSTERVHTLNEDTDSRLWIGTGNGLLRYNLQSKQLDYPFKNIGTINAIAFQSEEAVCLATEKRGLCMVRSDSDIQSYNESENFLTVDVAPNRTIWAGTSQGNVYYFSPDKSKLISVTEECGLNGDMIAAIKADNQGFIWILTNQRIIIYNPEEGSTNIIYSSDPSIAMDNFLSLYKDEDGTILVSGTGGFCSFSSFGNENTTKNVPVKLSSIKIGNQTRLIGYAEKEITLQPDEQSIDLFFSTFDPLNAKKIRYAFRYNTSSDWNYLPEGQNSIYLTGLSKGTHQLEVKATNCNGHWGNNNLAISIHRLPAWYETTLAYSIYTLLFIILVYVLLHYYIERKKQKLINKQIHNSAKDIQALICQLSEDILTPASTDGLDLRSLLVGIQKVLQQQKEKTSVPVSSTDTEPTLSVSDEKFIQKALDYIEQNIDNSNYSVELLSKDLGMERTGLYRKLVSIIGRTPTDFIRSTRLKRAALLLKEGVSVSEAADRVGFGTASYLSKCFLKEFGMKPSEYIDSLKQPKNKAEK